MKYCIESNLYVSATSEHKQMVFSAARFAGLLVPHIKQWEWCGFHAIRADLWLRASMRIGDKSYFLILIYLIHWLSGGQNCKEQEDYTDKTNGSENMALIILPSSLPVSRGGSHREHLVIAVHING